MPNRKTRSPLLLMLGLAGLHADTALALGAPGGGFSPVGQQSCPSTADYALQPPVLTNLVNPIPLLAGDQSSCAAVGPNAPCARHRIYAPHPTASLREPLVVFLPGTKMNPHNHDQLLMTAAYAGYRTIGLSYDNTTKVSSVCTGAVNTCGNDCTESVRKEVILGVPSSPLVNVQFGDAIVVRLYRLLEELHALDPLAGWDSYFTPATGAVLWSDIHWENIIIAGFSQGGGHAAMIAHAQPVMGLMVIEGAGDKCNDPVLGDVPAEWMTATPDASAGRPKYAALHRRGLPLPVPVPETLQLLGFGSTSFSIDATLPQFDVIDQVPPAMVSVTDQGTPPGCSVHASMARDGCLPENFAGLSAAPTPPDARWFGPYLSRFCHACDSGVCP